MTDQTIPFTEKQCFILEGVQQFGAIIVDDDATIYQMTDRQLVAYVEHIAEAVEKSAQRGIDEAFKKLTNARDVNGVVKLTSMV